MVSSASFSQIVKSVSVQGALSHRSQVVRYGALKVLPHWCTSHREEGRDGLVGAKGGLYPTPLDKE